MKWKIWLKGLISAVVSSAVGGVALVIVKPLDYNISDPAAAKRLLLVCGALAAIGVANYLKKSPMPD